MKIQLLCIVSIIALLTASLANAELDKDKEAEARRLINALGCKGCHKLEGDGGELAPELDKIGSRMTRVQISTHLAAHSKTRTRGFMPSYSTTPEEDLKTISDFLYNLK